MANNIEHVWTSLEATKLLVQALVPISIFALGYLVSARTRKLEDLLWKTHKTTEWRKELFDRIIPKAGTLRCAYTYVGSWQSLSPSDVIALKRQLDSEIYAYAELLTTPTMKAYEVLMAAAFETQRGRGTPLRIRANVDRYRESPLWRDEFAECFVPPAERTRRCEFDQRYREFVKLFFSDVAVAV